MSVMSMPGEATITELRKPMYHFALRLTRNQEEAQDLVQEALVKVLSRWAQYDGSRSLVSWANSIMRNLFIDGVRRQNRHVATVSFEHVEIGQLLVREVVDPSPTPEEQAIEADTRRHLNTLVNRIPLVFRDTARMHYLEGKSMEEISAREGIAVSTVRTRLMRARRRIRVLMEQA